jgi:hypothetical protein
MIEVRNYIELATTKHLMYIKVKRERLHNAHHSNNRFEIK